MPIAFFDLDRTLLRVNSGSLWVKSELRQGFLTRMQAARATVYIAGYHLGFSKMEPLLLEAIAAMTGTEEAVIKERTQRFYDAEVAGTIRPGARDAVEWHRAQGHTLAMLTSSSPYLSEPVREELRLDHVLCMRFEVKDGRFTGKPDGPLCFGPAKVTHAAGLAERLGEKLEDAWFYTDSASDLRAMEAVGHPVAVHPDPTLRRIAKKRAWPIVSWDAAAKAAS